MTYDEFYNQCSFDIVDGNDKNSKTVVGIFSCGFMHEFPKDLIKEHESVAKDIVARDLYNHLDKSFSE